jgi:hypothetical protein
MLVSRDDGAGSGISLSHHPDGAGPCLGGMSIMVGQLSLRIMSLPDAILWVNHRVTEIGILGVWWSDFRDFRDFWPPADPKIRDFP